MPPVRIIKDHYVVQTDTPGQLLAIFPSAKQAVVQGKPYLAVPVSLDAARILNNLGFKAPSPIRTKYDWPGLFTPRWYQLDTADFFTLNPRCHCHNAPRCVDKDTEFLTPTGWKPIDQYVESDLVAQWVPETDQAEFVAPQEYIDMPCKEMIHIKTSAGIDQMLTRNHRVPYISAGPKKDLRETTAGVIHERNQVTAGWRGKLPVTFRAPEAEGLPLTDNEIRVMVMTIADGWFQSSTPRCHVRVKKVRKKERARMLLRAARLEFKEHQRDYSTAVGFSIFRFTAPRREKEFTEFWWAASEAQLQVIMDEAKHWDGSLRRNLGAFTFHSSSKASADFIQYAAVATKHVAAMATYTRERRGTTEEEHAVYVRAHGRPLGIVYNGGKGAGKRSNTSIVPAPGGRCYCFGVPSTYLILRRNGHVFITGNTGKTLSALWASDYLRRTKRVNSVLIVAPLSTLWDVWEQNIFESFPLRTYAVLHGPRQKRLDLLAEKRHYYIVNHHGVNLIEEALRKRPDIDLVIVDEAAEFFNSRAKTLWKPLNKVINKHGTPRMAWGLTGTPTPEGRPTDAFGQCKLLTPEKYHGTFTQFKRETMLQVSTFKWVPKKGSETTVRRVLSPSIRYERTVCSNMKPCLIERRAELSTEQQKHYSALLKKAVTEIKGSAVTAVNAAVLIQKLVQTAAGVVYGADGSILKMDFGPRLKVLEQLIRENDEKVIVFAPFTGVLDTLAAELRKNWTVGVVQGSVSAKKRTDIFRAFRSSKDPHVIVAHPGCMAHGLDMTAASLAIWYAPIHANKHYEQACARIDGSRQEVKIDIAHIYATKEEQRIYAALREKKRLQDVVLDLVKINS